MQTEELLKKLADKLEKMTDDDGYSSYLSDEEKEREPHIVEARELISFAREIIASNT